MYYTYQDNHGAIVTNDIPDGTVYSMAVGPSGTDVSGAAYVPYAGVAITIVNVTRPSIGATGVLLPADAPVGATIILYTNYADVVNVYTATGQEVLVTGTATFNNGAPAKFQRINSGSWLKY